jgi:hypothetical protein
MQRSRNSLTRCVAVLVLLVAACGPIVPATTPPQLKFTPGPAVVVTDRTYETRAFTVRYPSGWRVVTGAADQPISVVFVAPDEVSTITVQAGYLNNTTFDEAFQTDVRGITLGDGTVVTAIGRAPVERWATFGPVFEMVIASVQ